MANKRMFNMKICDSDAFLDMPLSSQALYFHLNMRADDDGFVGNPKRIVRTIGANEDDLKLLIAKRFVLSFEDGVIVIKHWKMHNCIQKDRYHPTVYQDELKMLYEKDNKSYTFDSEKGERIQNVSNMETKRIQNVSSDLGLDLDLDSDSDLGLDSDSDLDLTVSKDTVCQTEVRQVIDNWNDLRIYGIKPISKISSSSKRYKSLTARIREYGIEDVLKAIDKIRVSDFLQGKNNNGWMITFDWFVLPNNFPKVLEGNYDNKKPDNNNQDDPLAGLGDSEWARKWREA